MEDVFSEIGKGFLRAIGYILAEIFYGTICYWVGWPICKLLTFGRYPKPKQFVYLEADSSSGFWCSAVGFMTIIITVLYFAGAFAS